MTKKRVFLLLLFGAAFAVIIQLAQAYLMLLLFHLLDGLLPEGSALKSIGPYTLSAFFAATAFLLSLALGLSIKVTHRETLVFLTSLAVIFVLSNIGLQVGVFSLTRDLIAIALGTLISAQINLRRHFRRG